MTTEKKNKCRLPCNECPFNPRSVVGPTAHGAFDPDAVLGQAYGPFFLPCHKGAGYDGKNTDITTAVECAGAAIFRSNCAEEITWELPPALLKLPADTEHVFAGPAEFIAYHRQITLLQAMTELAVKTPVDMLNEQLQAQENKFYHKEHLTPLPDDSLIREMTLKLISLENDVLMQVIWQALGRHPKPEDFNHFTKRMVSSAIMDYDLLYGQTVLGRVRYHTTVLPFRVDFTPAPEFADKLAE